MTPSEARTVLEQLCAEARRLTETARTASRNRKSLHGANYYGQRFHAGATRLAQLLTRLAPILTRLTEQQACDAYECLKRACAVVGSPGAGIQTRTAAVKSLELACRGTLDHALERSDEPAAALTERVLASDVVRGTRGYLERLILYANGNYERGWYDPAGVMIRRFVEVLIIAVYEHARRADDIKGSDGDFVMLGELIDRVCNDPAFNLARETKKVLPIVKQLGDRSAHNRRYLARRADVDAVIPGLRVLADDLLHLAGLRR